VRGVRHAFLSHVRKEEKQKPWYAAHSPVDALRLTNPSEGEVSATPRKKG